VINHSPDPSIDRSVEQAVLVSRTLSSNLEEIIVSNNQSINQLIDDQTISQSANQLIDHSTNQLIDDQTIISLPVSSLMVKQSADNSDIKLVPSDIKERAIFEQWMSLESTTYTPEISIILRSFFGVLYFNIPRDEACKKAGENLLRDGAVLNKQLDGKTWIVNDKFSLVDICFLTCLVPIVDEPEIKEWFAKYPNIAAWLKNATARPGWQKVIALGKN
jgi:hypothetical protein